MEEIAAAAGVTKGTIYLYFHNKEDLFVDTLRRQAAMLVDPLPAFQVTVGTDVEGMARQMAEGIVEVLMSPGMVRVVPLFIAEMNHLPALKRAYQEEWLPQVNLRLAEALRAGMELGVLRPLDPVIAARALLGMFSVFVLSQEVFEAKVVTPMARRDIAKTIVTIFFRGVLATQ
jgi:AcrR family transcriptional regulator